MPYQDYEDYKCNECNRPSEMCDCGDYDGLELLEESISENKYFRFSWSENE